MRNILLFLSLLLFSSGAFAETAQDSLLMTVFSLSTKYVSTLLGAIFVYIGLLKLYAHSKDGRDQKNSIGSIVATLFAGSLLLNVNIFSNMLTQTFLGDGFCFLADSSKNTNKYGSCFTTVQSTTDKYLGELSGKSTDIDTVKLNDKIRLLFTLFQVIAMMYIMKGLYALKSISEGKSNSSYGSTLVQLFAASLFLNLPRLLDLIYETLKSFKL
jgi:hypothetical protein